MPTSVAFRETLKWLANCSFILIPVNTLGSPSVLCECFLSISGELVLSFWTLKLSRSEHVLETANQMQRHFFPEKHKMQLSRGCCSIPEHNRSCSKCCLGNPTPGVQWCSQLLIVLKANPPGQLLWDWKKKKNPCMCDLLTLSFPVNFVKQGLWSGEQVLEKWPPLC